MLSNPVNVTCTYIYTVYMTDIFLPIVQSTICFVLYMYYVRRVSTYIEKAIQQIRIIGHYQLFDLQ